MLGSKLFDIPSYLPLFARDVSLLIDNIMFVSSEIKSSGETRNSVGMARLAEPVRHVSGLA